MIVWMLSLIMGLFVVSIIIYELRRLYWEKGLESLMTVTHYPLIGSAALFFGKKPEELIHVMQSIIKEEIRVVKFWVGPCLCIGICDPENMQIILNSNSCIDKNYFYKFFPNSGGIFSLPSNKWKIHRKILNPTFSPKILNSYREWIDKKTEIFLQQVSKGAMEKTSYNLDIHLYLFNLTMELTLNTLAGYETNIQSAKDSHKFIEIFEELTDLVALRVTKIQRHPEFIHKLLPCYKELNEKMEFFTSILKDVRKRKELELEKARMMGTEPFKMVNGKIEWDDKCLIPLNKLYKLYEEGQITDKDIEEELTTLFFGGLDTTAGTLTSTVLMLAIHQDVQEKLLDEVVSIFGTDPNVYIDPTVKMPYLEMVIKETLRLLPVAAIVGRKNVEPIKLTTCTIPAGCNILLGIGIMHRNKKIWGPNADKFNPENFSPDNLRRIHSWAWLPFTGGPRVCIGIKYSWLVMKKVLPALLLKFKFTTDLKMDDLQIRYSIVTHILNRNRLRFEPRVF